MKMKRKLIVLVVAVLAVLGGFANYGKADERNEYQLQEKIWEKLQEHGFNEYSTAAVLGCIEVASDFKTDAEEPSDNGGIGLLVWSFGRKEQLIEFSESKGKHWNDEDIQIEFLLGELSPDGGADGFANYQILRAKGFTASDFLEAENVEFATIAFCKTFERTKTQRFDSRIEAARKYQEMFGDK